MGRNEAFEGTKPEYKTSTQTLRLLHPLPPRATALLLSHSHSVPPCAGQGGLHGPRFFRSSRLLSHIFCPWFVVYPFHAIFRCLFFLLSSRYINSRFLTSTATLAILSSQHTHTHTQSGVACVLLRTSPFLVHCAAARFVEATKSTQKKSKNNTPRQTRKIRNLFRAGVWVHDFLLLCCPFKGWGGKGLLDGVRTCLPPPLHASETKRNERLSSECELPMVFLFFLGWHAERTHKKNNPFLVGLMRWVVVGWCKYRNFTYVQYSA